MRTTILSVVLLCSSAQLLAQATLATATDLRAAFCVDPLRRDLELIGDARATSRPDDWDHALEKAYQLSVNNNKRLRRYLNSRIATYDEKALTEYRAALAAGRDASARAMTIAETCIKKFENTPITQSDADEMKACADRMGVNQLQLNQCDDLSFLP